MSSNSKMSVGKKIFSLVFIGGVSLAVLGGISYSYFKRISFEVDAIAERYMPAIESLTALEAALLEKSIHLNKAMLFKAIDNKEDFSVEIKKYQEYSEKSSKYMTAAEEAVLNLRADTTDEKKLALIADIENSIQKSSTLLKTKKAEIAQLIQQVEIGSVASNIDSIKKIDASSLDLAHSVEEKLFSFEQFTTKAAIRAEELEHEAMTWIVIISIAMASFFILLGWIIASSIKKDLTRVAKLLTEASENTTTQSSDLKAISSESTRSVLSQSASIEETSASCEQITAMLRNTLGDTQKSTDFASEVKREVASCAVSVEESQKTLTSLLQSMEDLQSIAKMMRNIGEKTGIIDNIVFQTRILSFNASVEAERAGEAGRGFAVVAQEIGALADASKTSSSEISELLKSSVSTTKKIIDSSSDKISDGAQSLNNALSMFKKLESMVKSLEERLQNIKTASNEQAMGVGQINQALTQLDTETNEATSRAQLLTASSEALQTCAHSISSQVNDLQRVVSGGSLKDKVEVEDIISDDAVHLKLEDDSDSYPKAS